MFVCVRTTINLPDGLAEAVKARAVAEGRTFTSVVEEALRAVLAAGKAPADDVELPAFGSPEGRFLVDPRHPEALWAALDADPPR